MSVRKPWTAWDSGADLRAIPGAMGIYEIADQERQTLYIGKAGGAAPFGLRGELYRHCAQPEDLASANWTHPQLGHSFAALAGRARYYRYELNHQYYGRWIEALTRYREDYGTLPPANLEDPEPIPKLGRYHWSSEEAGGGPRAH